MSEPAAPPARPTDERRTSWTEFAAVLIISLTAVLTAWTSYQSAKWGGEQSLALGAASANRVEAESYFADAREQFVVDVDVFSSWFAATATGDDALARTWRQVFPPTLDEAFEDWIAQNPLSDDAAPQTPFEEYVYRAETQGERLEARAERASEAAARNSTNSDNYTGLAIIFATVILFAALSDKFRSRRVRRVTLGLSLVGLLVGVAITATFPVVL